MTSGASRRPRRARVALAAPLVIAAYATAVEPQWDFATLMSQLAQVQTSRVRYSEVRRLAVLKQPLTLSGTMLYERPDRIEKRQELPFAEVIRVSGERFTLERDGNSRSIQLQAAPLVAALVGSLRAILAGDSAELERLYAVTVEGAKSRWNLRLLPKEPEIGGVISRIDITGFDSHLSRIEILQPGGDSSVMILRDPS